MVHPSWAQENVPSETVVDDSTEQKLPEQPQTLNPKVPNSSEGEPRRPLPVGHNPARQRPQGGLGGLLSGETLIYSFRTGISFHWNFTINWWTRELRVRLVGKLDKHVEHRFHPLKWKSQPFLLVNVMHEQRQASLFIRKRKLHSDHNTSTVCSWSCQFTFVALDRGSKTLLYGTTNFVRSALRNESMLLAHLFGWGPFNSYFPQNRKSWIKPFQTLLAKSWNKGD